MGQPIRLVSEAKYLNLRAKFLSAVTGALHVSKE